MKTAQSRFRSFAVAVAVLFITSPARAGGIALPGYGSQAQPRAGAFTAKADDPSAIYHNPAGMMKIPGTAVYIGVNLVGFDQSFERAGTYESTGVEGEEVDYAGDPFPRVEDETSPVLGVGDLQAVPLLAVTSDLGLDLPLVFGAGVFAPAAGYPNREYTPDYELEANPSQPPPPQRYDVLAQEVTTILPSVAAAYRILPNLDVGVRVSWGVGEFQGRTSLWGIRNYEEWEAQDSIFSIDVHDSFIPAFGAGILYRPMPSVELGLNYRSATNIDAVGNGQAVLGSALAEAGVDALDPILENPRCAGGGTAVNLKTCLEATVPQTAALGARYIFRDGSGRERGDVELDVHWEDWSAGSTTIITVDARSPLGALQPTHIRHGFVDSFSFRLGGSYSLPLGSNLLAIRAGAAHDTKTAPLSWTRLDLDSFPRTTLGLGVGFETGSVRIDLGGGAVIEGTRTVTSSCNPTAAAPGCDGSGMETPVDERTAPDPSQPDRHPSRAIQSPFNAGTYEQSYVVFSLGVTTWF